MKDEKEIEVSGVKYVRADSVKKAPASAARKKGLEYCIVRTYSAGVFAGYYDRKRKGKEGTVYSARRIWYWDGAASLSQMANDGVKKPENCKFSQVNAEVDLKEIIEVIPCSAAAKKIIEMVKVWQQ